MKLKAKQLVEDAFVDDPQYDIEAHGLAYDFIELEIGHFYFPESWQKHREYYVEKLGEWLIVRAKGYKVRAVLAELDELAGTGLRWSDHDEIYFPDPNEDLDAIEIKPARR